MYGGDKTGNHGDKHLGKSCLSGRRKGIKVGGRSTNMGKCREKVIKGLVECKSPSAHYASLTESLCDHCCLFTSVLSPFLVDRGGLLQLG